MLAQQIRHLGSKYNLITSKFEKIFRDRALGRAYENLLRTKVDISYDEFVSIMQFKDEFGELFFELDSHQLFWICRCLYFENKSLLSFLNKYVATVCSITRGNLNTYKLNGWDVHVLYVYQLVNYNFAECVIPSAYCWEFDVMPIFNHFHQIYNELSANARFILKVGSFLHDIGVTLGVKDHEAKGIALTENYFKELGITKTLLENNKIDLNEEEILTALKAIIGNHQIINQIAAEASDMYIYEKINAIKESFSFSDRLISIFNSDFVGLMSILAISDMMAVDDSLLSEEKYSELNDAYHFLVYILSTDSYKRDPKIYGPKRLVSLLKDDLKMKATNSLHQLTAKNDDRGINIINFLYHTKFLSYAMAAIKPLANVEKSLKLIEICIEIHKSSSIKIENLTIKFNPDINTLRLSNILEEHIFDIMSQKLIESTIDNHTDTIEISC